MTETHPLQERAESRVLPERVELGRGGDEDERPIAFLEGPIEPLEGVVVLTQADMGERDPDR